MAFWWFGELSPRELKRELNYVANPLLTGLFSFDFKSVEPALEYYDDFIKELEVPFFFVFLRIKLHFLNVINSCDNPLLCTYMP